MRIRRLRQMDYFMLLIVIAFALDFGYIKYALAGLFSVLYFFAGKSNIVTVYKNTASNSFILILKGLCVLFAITAILQMKNGFNSYAINEAIYFLTPLVFTWVYTDLSEQKQIERVIDYVFAIFVASFIITFASQLTLENIRSISFLNSYSPFESERAFIFLFFECYYLKRKEKKRALLALVLCVLSFKRMCLLVALIIPFISRWLGKRRRVDPKLVILITAFFVLLPTVTCVVVNPAFDRWFYSEFGVSLDALTLSRTSRIELVMNSDDIKYGLGSVTTYITKALNDLHGSSFSNRNLHNDLVRIYLECGIIGSVVFTYVFLKASSFARSIFIVVCYVFVECYFNHLFGAGTADLWIVIYLIWAHSAHEVDAIK